MDHFIGQIGQSLYNNVSSLQRQLAEARKLIRMGEK